MSKSHLEILVQGVGYWNRWRKDRPKAEPELAGANLRGQELTGVDLHGADLREAVLTKAYLSQADFGEANLREADLGGANLTAANLAKAYLFKANLGAANLNRADLRGAELFGANLCESNLREAKLAAAFLSRAALRGANLNRADLRGADLRGADLRDANLSRADLSGANLSTADLGGANLTHALLDHALLTGAVLWETQRAGWSVFEVSCEYVFWELNGRRRLSYAPGEFEALNTTRTQIELFYPGGLAGAELATLPLLLRALQRGLPGHPLQLRHLEEQAAGTRLVLEFEDEAEIPPDMRLRLKDLAEERAADLVARQREALAGPDAEQIHTRLGLLEEQLFPGEPDPEPDPEPEEAPERPDEARTPLQLGALPAAFAAADRPVSIFLDLDPEPEPAPPRHLDAAAEHPLTEGLLHQVPHSYSPDGGESAVIGFDSPLGGIRFALEYLESLRQQRSTAPLPSGEGPALVSYQQLGEGTASAADEVLVSEALRHHPEVANAPGLSFVPVERRVKNPFGDKQSGDTIRCFQVVV